MILGTHNALDDARNETVKIFINGELIVRKDAKISVFDSGYLVGDGVWEALRLHKGVLVFLDLHLKRLWQSAISAHICLPFSKEELTNHIWDTIKCNQMHDDVHVRIMITRGIKKTPSQDPRLTLSGPNIVIIAEHKKASPQTKQKGITLFTSTIRRGSPDYLDPRLNCHSKLHEVQALIQAIEAGADEALMLDIHGFVSTCNATNFFIIKDSEVWTSTGQYCMNGITRGKIISICDNNKIPCKQKNFSLFDVYAADEAFVTGSFGGVTPVTKIDGRIIGDGKFGKLSRKLNHLYEQLIAEEITQKKPMHANNIKRICLWSGPRNISTALMYSFAQRSDTLVYDEPLYAYYLKNSNAKEYHPGTKEILSSMENNGTKVIEMMMGFHEKPVVFFKNMTHHLLNLDRSFMLNMAHIILTRDPLEMLPSYAKVIENPNLKDVGYAAHTDLVNELNHMNIKPIIVDSKTILKNPKSTLNHLCTHLKIPFEENMLKWKMGARVEDGIWSKYWYENIHKSVGFKKYKAKKEPFPKALEPLLKECTPHYKNLIKLSLK